MKAAPSIWRARLLVGALAVLVFLLVGAGVSQAWRASERAALLRHQLVAERLFDSMERTLNEFLEAEEGRPFVEYRPADGLLEPKADYVAGYFQLDPDGTLTNPHRLSPEESALLTVATVGVTGWGNDTPHEAPREMTVKVAVDVPAAPSPTSTAKKVVKSQAPTKQLLAEELPLENTLNFSSGNRAGRAVQQQRSSLDVFNGWSNDEQANAPQQQLKAPNEPLIVPEAVQRAADPPQQVWVPVQIPVPEGGTTEVVDVLVEPFVVVAGPDDTLVLTRTVRLEDRSWVQGLVVRQADLQAHLIASNVGATELAAYLSFDWSGNSPPASADYGFEHTFAEPFEQMSVSVALAKLPDTGTGAEQALLALSMLLLLIALLGLAAVYRMVAVTLRYAEQRADFVSAVTHELKSPLTSIRMYSEMLESGMVADPDRRNDYYTTIRLESERLGRLVDDVLAFSRIERGLPAAHGDTGTVGEVLDDVIRLLAPQADALGATLQVEASDVVRGHPIDRDALSHVLTNLLDNALKFSADAEHRIVTLTAAVEGDRIVVAVRDRGPGVPQHLMRRIFEPFFRGERELTRKTKGTGIGLALVTSLVDRMDGAIDATNHPEGGLVVTVRCPTR